MSEIWMCDNEQCQREGNKLLRQLSAEIKLPWKRFGEEDPSEEYRMIPILVASPNMGGIKVFEGQETKGFHESCWWLPMHALLATVPK